GSRRSLHRDDLGHDAKARTPRATPDRTTAMPRIQTFNVTPSIPAALDALTTLAHDLAFSWRPDIQALFCEIDPAVWNASNHNPVALLARVDEARLKA